MYIRQLVRCVQFSSVQKPTGEHNRAACTKKTICTFLLMYAARGRDKEGVQRKMFRPKLQFFKGVSSEARRPPTEAKNFVPRLTFSNGS